MAKKGSPNEEHDLFRDTWVRYLGYANEVGESFRNVVPRSVVRWSYTVAFAYVLADTADKSLKSWRKHGEPTKVLIATGDALIWQTLASVVIPGYTINRIRYYTYRFLCKQDAPYKLMYVATVVAGLVSIPIIVQPIDKGVTMLLDSTYRQWFKK